MVVNSLCAFLLSSLRPEKASPALLIICAIILEYICAAEKNIVIFAGHPDAAHLPVAIAIAPIAFPIRDIITNPFQKNRANPCCLSPLKALSLV